MSRNRSAAARLKEIALYWVSLGNDFDNDTAGRKHSDGHGWPPQMIIIQRCAAFKHQGMPLHTPSMAMYNYGQ